LQLVTHTVTQYTRRMKTFRQATPWLLLLLAACKPPELPPPPARPAAAVAALPFDKAVKLGFAWDAKEGAVVATLHLEPGFHAYGPGETTGKPISLEVNAEGWTVKEVRMPAAQKKDLGDLGMSFVYTGDVEVRAVMTSATAGAPVTGKLNYQVCSETSCDRPRSATFNLKT
jgi:hypothetical protein